MRNIRYERGAELLAQGVERYSLVAAQKRVWEQSNRAATDRYCTPQVWQQRRWHFLAKVRTALLCVLGGVLLGALMGGPAVLMVLLKSTQ